MLSKCSREYAQHLNLNGAFIENLQEFKALLNLKKKYIYILYILINLIMFILNYIIFLRKVFFITFTSFII